MTGDEATPDDGARRRARMVERDLAPRGIRDPRVVDAMATVPRERFVPSDLGPSAYDDRALPIGSGQTISQPYVVAAMAQAASVGPGDRILEIGTGSGYGAAVLAATGAEVWTVERHRDLAESAREDLDAAGAERVHVRCDDGTLGWQDEAPFDAIVVTAAAPAVPEALVGQLVDGGRLVIPVGATRHAQHLLRVTRRGDGVETEDLGDVAFVPLIGEEGWSEPG